MAAETLMSSTAASVVACNDSDGTKPTISVGLTIENKDMFATPEMVWIESPGDFNLDEWEFDLSSIGVEITKENINAEINKFLLNSLSPALKDALKKDDFLNEGFFDKGLSLKEWFDKYSKNLLHEGKVIWLLNDDAQNVNASFDSGFYIKDYDLDNQLI
ncbi:hypothetical protein SCLARK_00527 [Spiroplasma clarkii]|uniref:Uncharacterized protein n=2 Tax=Spiroplasma clarkii TaxID=2139 RepID=A0A1Y0L0E2_9MOLU|nr:hypothetical protein [Spiroplasma clarkii]ARU91215.1 hypothetical protein SCLARK_00527 [Spiroplasma clarkii]ATX70655.1 hypothetical protein SCLAR_v1c03250 [Spiroplasma clarkii]